MANINRKNHMTLSPLSPMFGTKLLASGEVVKMDTQVRHAVPRIKPIVIYHGNCADGFGAAWCFHSLWKDSYDYHAGVYGKEPPDCTDRIVYLVDFSYKREVVKKICDVASAVILLDHHASAIADLAPLSDDSSDDYQSNFIAVTDLERSGAMIAWDFLYNNFGESFEVHPWEAEYKFPPLLLNHIQDRDLWKFKLNHTREISAALFSYEYSFDMWDILMSADQAELLQMTVAGAAIERKHHKDIAELIKVVKRLMCIGDWIVPVASLPYTLTSDAGHAMARDYKEGKLFAACYWDTAEERIFSLRSTENGMDVSKIAEQYGGGGHKNAAGFKVPRSHYLATC